MFFLSNLVTTEVNLPLEGPHLAESHPEEADRLTKSEMVNVVTSPTPHPEEPKLRFQQILHLRVGLGSEKVLLGGLGNYHWKAN